MGRGQGVLSSWVGKRSAHGMPWLLLVVLLTIGCGASSGTPTAGGSDASEVGDDGVDERASEDANDPVDADGAAGDTDAAAPSDDDTEERTEPPTPVIDPAEVGADELGLVPVLMYHRLREDGGSDYDLTAEEFRGELEWLFENGYSPVTTIDFARGTFDIPAGRTPVVLTFDDSTREQAWLEEDGSFAGESAAGILIDVAADYEDVEPVASFYVITSSLFGGTADGPDILAALHESGMEIGNHTHEHSNLGQLDDQGVIEELARATTEIRALVPDAEVATLSLPFGANPEHRELLHGGEELGYELEGVLLVGSGPAQSPYSGEFEGLAIPRIRSSPSWPGGESDWGSRFWLEQMETSSTYRRYISDGDPSTISFPAEYAADVDERFADDANPY